DDGNLVAGDCCSPLCQFDAGGTACTKSVCLSGTSCDGAGACVGGTPNTAPCNDGNACTTADTCAGRVCVGGPPPNCNDGSVCTTDSCDPATGCVNAPNTLPCNNGNACTTADTCAGGVCVGGPPPFCPPAAPAGTVTADAYVNSGSPTSNTGTSTILVADASP